ncbi:MAG: hypothetical protein ACO1RX_19750 [Candidatus Sericytochromatia bacterium]
MHPSAPVSRRLVQSLWALLALSLSACGPAPVQSPEASPSPASSAPGPVASPSIRPSADPVSPLPTATPLAPPVAVPSGTRLVLSADSRFLSRVGETTQLRVRLETAAGEALPLDASQLVYTSSRPSDITVSSSGLVSAQVSDGYSEMRVSLPGTGLQAVLRLSVSGGSSGSRSSGGGGSSGGGSAPAPTPTPLESLNVSLGFEGLEPGAFLVNTFTTSDQSGASVARDATGNFVVAWQSFDQGANSEDIYAQRYDSFGNPQGSEFRVNTYTGSAQTNPSVSLDADGDFVVAWQSDNQDGSSLGIYAQRYTSQGQAQGSEFRVNTTVFSAQSFPSVSLDADGDFVVAWQSYFQDGSNFGIYAQRYSSAGAAQGSEFRVNTYTSSGQGSPSVSLDADGDFVVAWQSFGQDGSGDGIYAQRYASAGAVQGSEFQVNTYTIELQSSPSVSLDADGDFVVAWQSFGQDGSGYGIYAQRYTSAGLVQGSEFQVNTYTSLAQSHPAVALDADGDFVVSWDSNAQDGSSYGVYGQRYTSTGVVQGSEFRVNTYTTNAQYRSSIALNAEGDFVVAWCSNTQDRSGTGIYARLYNAQGQAQ